MPEIKRLRREDGRGANPPDFRQRGEATLLQQCLANLLENAGKFANPQRDLCITIRSEQAPERTRGAPPPSLAFNPATFGAPNVIPHCSACFASLSTLATWSSAFDGMQPRYRQTPPGFGEGSMRVTCIPRSAA